MSPETVGDTGSRGWWVLHVALGWRMVEGMGTPVEGAAGRVSAVHLGIPRARVRSNAGEKLPAIGARPSADRFRAVQYGAASARPGALGIARERAGAEAPGPVRRSATIGPRFNAPEPAREGRSGP